jgi:2-dehydropantoate 2-reductase
MEVATEPERICIAGTGAIGGVLAARLAAAGHRVSVLARGATLQAIQAHGIRLTDMHGKLTANVAASDRAEFGQQDIVFVAVKAHDLPAMLAQIAPLIGPQTIVVPATNGIPWWYFHREGGRFDGSTVRAVDPDGRLPELLPLPHVLGCVVFITAEQNAPGEIVSSSPHKLILGEPSNELSARLTRVCAVLEGAGIEARASGRIRDHVWTKLAANLTSNPLSVVTEAGLGDLFGRRELHDVVIGIIDEAKRVASAYGARIEIEPKRFLEMGAALGSFRTSMLQDFERGRPLEIAAIGDAALELAGRHDIPMPITRTVLSLARFRSGLRNNSPKQASSSSVTLNGTTDNEQSRHAG